MSVAARTFGVDIKNGSFSRAFLWGAFILSNFVLAMANDSGTEYTVSLTESTFDEFLKTNSHTLVEFYAPWCGHCKKLAPEYEAAAKILKETNNVLIGKVDATAEESLATKYNVTGYPSLFFFREGLVEAYTGGRTSSAIVEWVTRMSGPSVDVVADMDAALAVAATNPVSVIGSFSTSDSSNWNIFRDVANKSRTFARFVAYVSSHVTVDEAAVYRLEGEDSKPAMAAKVPIVSADELKAMIMQERFPFFSEITAENYSDMVSANKTMAWFVGSAKEYETSLKAIQAVSSKFRSSHLFVWLDAEKYKEHAESALGLKSLPGMIVQKEDTRYMVPGAGSIPSAEDLTKFLYDVDTGNVEPHLLSDTMPETNDEAVKVVVGVSFKEMVLQKTKDVFLEVYAPWCGHCKKFEPLYNTFAETYGSDSLMVLKMDGTSNESPLEKFKWTGFPSIFFVKADSEEPIVYDGERTVAGLKEFAEKHGSYPLVEKKTATSTELPEELKDEL